MSTNIINNAKQVKLPKFKRSQISVKSCNNQIVTAKKTFKGTTRSHKNDLQSTNKKKKSKGKISFASNRSFVLSSITQQLQKQDKSQICPEELKSKILQKEMSRRQKAKSGQMNEEEASIEEIIHDENDPEYFQRDQNNHNSPSKSENSRHSTSVLSNRSSYFSQLSKMTLNLSQILQELEKKNLPIDIIFDKWPLYFSETKPVFSKKNLGQILVLSFLHKFITDHENKQLNYLEFKRREGEHPIEVLFDFTILKNCQENGDLLNENFDQKLFEIFRLFEQLPSEYLNSLNLALDNFNEWVLEKKPKRIVTRVKGKAKMIGISDIDTSYIDKFVKFRCQIVSVSAPRLFIRSMVS